MRREVDDQKATTNLDSRWFVETKGEEKEKEAVRTVLLNSHIQFRLLKKILRDLFNAKTLKGTELSEPNLDQRMYYYEGYRKALQDVYKILPKTIEEK